MTNIKKQLMQLNKMSKKSVALYHNVAISIGVSDSSLGILYALLEADTPCSQHDLFSEWAIPKQTVNSAVAALQKKGLVSLIPVPKTRNKKIIELTESGREFAEKTVRKLHKAELAALGSLNDEEIEQYIRLNKKYNDILAAKIEEITINDFT